jgi:hypothetical protein
MQITEDRGQQMFLAWSKNEQLEGKEGSKE